MKEYPYQFNYFKYSEELLEHISKDRSHTAKPELPKIMVDDRVEFKYDNCSNCLVDK